MSKFSQLPKEQAQHLVSFYLQVLSVVSAENQQLGQAGLRLLLVGNGAGIAFLAAFVGTLVQSGLPYDQLLLPFIFFVAGLVLGGLVYLPMIAVASNAASHVGTTIERAAQP